MPCGGGSKHVLPRRAWLMTTSGSTGRRWKRRYTAIATEKVVRFDRDQIGATETANNCISIESDRGARAVDFITDAMAAPEPSARRKRTRRNELIPMTLTWRAVAMKRERDWLRS